MFLFVSVCMLLAYKAMVLEQYREGIYVVFAAFCSRFLSGYGLSSPRVSEPPALYEWMTALFVLILQCAWLLRHRRYSMALICPIGFLVGG